ncbi:MAG: hypothetical protein HY741_14595 [Chloroflexi bacterium]|nr:hypothetical protein [Chloroflexota bacterium]
MAKIASDLQMQARANPSATFQIIVRVQGDMDARQAQLEAEGLTITRRSWLIHGFAASATGAWIESATDKEWIVSVERDAEIRAIKDKTN